MDSYLLTVEKAITGHLASTVSIDGALVKVIRGKEKLDSGDTPPLVTLIQAIDVEATHNQVGDGAQRVDTKLYLIQGFTRRSSGEENYDSAHELMAKVKQSLSELLPVKSSNRFLKQYNNGRYLVNDIKIATGLVRPPDSKISSNMAFFWLPVSITLIEDITDPYKLP